MTSNDTKTGRTVYTVYNRNPEFCGILEMRRCGGTGRRSRLKICRGSLPVKVRFLSPAPNLQRNALKLNSGTDDLGTGQTPLLLPPGQTHVCADQSISFQGAAHAAHLDQFWQGGSKQPAIVALLRAALESKPNDFCDLINEIVRKSLLYRQNKSAPLTREDIQTLNELLVRLEFKTPELRNPKFLDGLPSINKTAAVATLADAKRISLLTQLQKLSGLSPQPRGYAFEEFLKDLLFSLSNLALRSAFRLVGQQIDGSFVLQGETYLLEATWKNKCVGEEELMSFAGKVSGKAAWSHGLHLSYPGFTPDGLEAFARGKRTTIVCMDGLCLNDTLAHNLSLATVIERKVRRAAETNEAFVRVRDLFVEVK
jgi:hypothetical protein